MPKSLYLLFAALCLSGCGAGKVQSAGPPAPVPVTIAVATRESVPVQIRVIGNVEASAIVRVKSQVAGELLSVHFKEGQDVRKGDLLLEIDPRPYQQALRQSEAAVERDHALQQQAEANLARDIGQSKTAGSDAKRYDELAKEGIVSKTQNDQFRTAAGTWQESVRADRAAIESALATLASDRAAVDRAKLDLEYCAIRSPINGRTGNLLVQAGNLVKANGDNALVVIHQVNPIFVTFGAPEEHLAEVRRANASAPLAVFVSPQDDPGKSLRGTLAVIDNTVDNSTGTIRLKAVFQDDLRVLWPGQFVRVTLTLGADRDAVVIPAEAVQAGQQSQLVYVVKADKTVEARSVSAGRTVEGKVIIEKGIAAGETVVVDGQLRLFPGAHIQAVQPVKPAAGG